MKEIKLINENIDIGFSEPWNATKNLVEENTLGTILNVGNNTDKYYKNNEECLIIRLTEGFEYEGLECEYFNATPRHVKLGLSDLSRGNKVAFGLIRITKEQAEAGDFDTSWWRGAGAFIASINLSTESPRES